MGQGVSLILILIFSLVLFFGAYHLQENRYEVMDIKENLNLAAKALAKAVDVETENLALGAMGFLIHHKEIKVDQEVLLEEFYNTLYRNYYHRERYEAVRNAILLKVLVYHDRFYIADFKDQWSPPYFFTYPYGSEIYYATTLEDDLYYLDSNGNPVWVKPEMVGLTQGAREELMIQRLNSVIAAETARFNEGVPLKVEIKNPYQEGVDYFLQYGHFNALEGITFFVIYGDGKKVGVDHQTLAFTNYNVVGYTLEIEQGQYQ